LRQRWSKLGGAPRQQAGQNRHLRQSLFDAPFPEPHIREEIAGSGRTRIPPPSFEQQSFRARSVAGTLRDRGLHKQRLRLEWRDDHEPAETAHRGFRRSFANRSRPADIGHRRGDQHLRVLRRQLPGEVGAAFGKRTGGGQPGDF
jgi:hypothetical protein